MGFISKHKHLSGGVTLQSRGRADVAVQRHGRADVAVQRRGRADVAVQMRGRADVALQRRGRDGGVVTRCQSALSGRAVNTAHVGSKCGGRRPAWSGCYR
jgi:hypothetical protein